MANNKKTPRPYGRQSKDKTIKSLSLDADVAKWVSDEAKRRGVKDSSLVNELLKKLMLLALISALVRWLALGADPLTAAMGGVSDAGTVAYWLGAGRGLLASLGLHVEAFTQCGFHFC